MAIKSRNSISTDFSLASMSDLVFLLLIFFMITSTLVSPNAVKLLLPSSKSKTMAKQSVQVYINDQFQFLVDQHNDGSAEVVDQVGLSSYLVKELAGQADESSVVLRSDQSVPVQYIVTVIDIVNEINQQQGKKYKVILATKPADK
ncbi:MAG TPA: biopolymer transporter ExbD [Bacteroidales bacterium]|nr:biopolymer transporter ExbD [Bacteroidales bacterium]